MSDQPEPPTRPSVQEQARNRLALLVDRGAHICAEFIASDNYGCATCGYAEGWHTTKALLASHAQVLAENARMREALKSNFYRTERAGVVCLWCGGVDSHTGPTCRVANIEAALAPQEPTPQV